MSRHIQGKYLIACILLVGASAAYAGYRYYWRFGGHADAANFAQQMCTAKFGARSKLIKITSITKIPDGGERVCYVCS